MELQCIHYKGAIIQKIFHNIFNSWSVLLLSATEIGVLHELGPLCVNAMKEAMFEGPEILDKMLEDADIANKDDHPEEENKEESEEDKKEVCAEMDDILKDHETQNTVNGKNNTDETGEEVNKQIDENEDQNNNVCDINKPAEEVVQIKVKHILTFDQIYNKSAANKQDMSEDTQTDEKMDIASTDLYGHSALSEKTERYTFITMNVT